MLKKKEKNSYFWRLLFIKQNILKKRNYIYNNEVEKVDLLFDTYRDAIRKELLKKFELKRISLRFILKKKKFRNWFFFKLVKKGIAKSIKNEIFLIIPELLPYLKKAKSWRILKNKSKKKKIRRLKNVKKIVLHYFPNFRESRILREQLNKTYFWLSNTTKRQVVSAAKLNKLKKTYNIVDNYYRIKLLKSKKKLSFLKRNRKLYFYFLKNKRNIYVKYLKLFLLKSSHIVLLFSYLLKNIYLKFFYLKFFFIFSKFFKKSILGRSLNDIFNLSFKDFTLMRKRKFFKFRRRLKKKLVFFYNLDKKVKEIYKLKVRMVNSNFFITLTDYKNNVLMKRSTGQVSENRKKKVKLSPYLVTKMMYPVIGKLRKHKIKYLYFFVNSKINRHINNVMKFMKNNRYTKILKVIFSKPIAHHIGTRKPKLRRL